MNTASRARTDGPIGLGVLLLMTVAFVASESHSSVETTPPLESFQLPIDAKILTDRVPVERDSDIQGAIRELKIIPATIDSRMDLGWSSDDAVIEEYRRTGL